MSLPISVVSERGREREKERERERESERERENGKVLNVHNCLSCECCYLPVSVIAGNVEGPLAVLRMLLLSSFQFLSLLCTFGKPASAYHLPTLGLLVEWCLWLVLHGT